MFVLTAPPAHLWVDRDGRLSCPAHTGPGTWDVMVAAPTSVDVHGWRRVPAGMAHDVELLTGEPVGCDECRRGLGS